MKETILKWAGVVALVIALITIFVPSSVKQSVFGSTSCSNITCLAGGLRLVSDLGGDFESDVASVFTSTLAASSTAQVTGQTTLYGGINVVTSNTATSTTKTGCIQTTATSTASPVVITFTPYAGTTTTSGSNSNFLVAARFGTCPI